MATDPLPSLPQFVSPLSFFFPFTPSLPSPVFPFYLPFSPLEVGTPKIQLGSLGKHCELPSRVWGGAPTKIKLGAFWCMRSGGKDLNYFTLTKLANFVQFKRMFMFCLKDWGVLGPLGLPWLRH